MTTTIAKITVYKDTWTPSRPWNADVYWKDGKVWKSWAHGFSTRQALVQHINAVSPEAEIEFVRGE